MANTFITPTVIAARALATLYNTIVVSGLIPRDYDAEFAGKVGDTITVMKPAIFTAETFDRTKGVTVQDAVEDSIPVKLDTVANVSFRVTDEQMTLVIDDFTTRLLNPAMEAIAQKVDGDLTETLVDEANASATAHLKAGGGVVTLAGGAAANTVTRAARTILTRAKMPLTGRVQVLSPEAAALYLGDPLVVQAQQAGSTDALREAVIGRIFGFDTYEAQALGEGSGDRGQADGVAFHPGTIVLVTRPLQQPRGIAASQSSVQDYRGLSLRTVYAYNHAFKQDEVSIDMLYGIAETRPEGVTELDFGQGS